MKNRVLIVAILLICLVSGSSFAVTGDLNTDDKVNFLDYAVLASGWLTTYDVNDLSDMADNWLYGCEAANVAPTIDPNSVPSPNAVTYEDCYFELVGSDSDNGPAEKLAYIITSLPSNGKLYDISEWAGEIVAAQLPYQIGNFSTSIVYRGTVATTDTFNYKLYDGNDYSDEATVSINISANSADSLCFDGSGYATIPDSNDTIDLIDGRGVAFFFRTTKEDCGVLSKRNSSGGYEVRIENGRLRVCLYDSSGPVGCYGSVIAPRTDTGRWYIGGFSYFAGNFCVIISGVEDGDTWTWQDDYDGSLQIPTGPYANTADLYVGKATGFDNFIGEFDRLRFYSGCYGGSFDLKLLFITSSETRTDPNSTSGMSGPIEPDVRFMFDEGTGTSLTDDRGGLSATATDTDWLDAYGNDPVPVNPLEEKYYFKKYKNPYDQVSADKVIGNRKRY